jgi:hypothetical protein
MKTIKILQLIALTLALALADAPRSQAVTINWITDTSGAFDVVITGTGLWNSTTLHNTYWAVGAHVWFASNDPSAGQCSIANGGDTTTYLGTINGIPDPYETIQGYSDIFPQSAPVVDGAGFWNTGAGPTSAFTGSATVTITSMPNPNDVSTWTWTDEVHGQVVPEPGTSSLCIVGFGLFAASRLGRRSRFAPNSSKL